MQNSAQGLAEVGGLYDPLFVLAWIGVTMAQGALGVVLLIGLRRWRYADAGALQRWSQVTWGALLIACLCYPISVALPLPSWLCVLMNLSLFTLWVARAARWAAQE